MGVNHETLHKWVRTTEQPQTGPADLSGRGRPSMSQSRPMMVDAPDLEWLSWHFLTPFDTS